MPKKQRPMNHEERRRVIEAPISFSESGGKSHGGAYRQTEREEELSRSRYLLFLERRRQAESEGG